MSKSLISSLVRRVSAFATELGAGDRMTLAASEKLHTDYLKASEEEQARVKEEFVSAYFVGRTGLKAEQAIIILAMSRTEREAKDRDYENAKRVGEQKFDYHFIDRGPKANSGPNAKGSKGGKNLAKVLKGLKKGAAASIEDMVTEFFGGDYDKAIMALTALKGVAKAKAKKAEKAAA